eukprot:scaffold12267_cov120-Isochrysis_galbana.AAC.7
MCVSSVCQRRATAAHTICVNTLDSRLWLHTAKSAQLPMHIESVVCTSPGMEKGAGVGGEEGGRDCAAWLL